MTRVGKKSATTAPPQAHPASNGPPPDGPGLLHTVKPGESLRSIADKVLGDAERWTELAAANPQIKDPALVFAGDQLRLPSSGAAGRLDRQHIDACIAMAPDDHVASFAASQDPDTHGALPSKKGVLNLLSASKPQAASKPLPVLRSALRQGPSSTDFETRDRQREAVRFFKDHPQLLDAADVQALHRLAAQGGDRRTQAQSGEARAVLAKVLEEKESLSTARLAARALLDAPSLDPASQQSLVDYAAQSGSADLKKAVLDKLPDSPVGARQLKRVSSTYGSLVRDKIKSAPQGSQWQQLGRLLAAREMANSPDWKDNIDRGKLDKKINTLANGALKDDLAALRRQAIQRSTPPGLADAQERFIKSEAFQQRLALVPKDAQKALIQNEMAKLEGLAPDRVRESAEYLAGRAVQERALATFQALESEPGAQASALGATIDSVTGATSTSSAVTKKIVGVLNKLDPHLPNQRIARQLIHGLEEAQVAARRAGEIQDAGRAKKALDLIKNLDKNGKLSTVLSGAALLGVVAKGVPQNGEEWARSSSAVLSASGNASDIGKLFRLGTAGTLGRALKFMDWLGPAGDLVGAGADAYGAWKDFEQGDSVGGWSKSVGAASGVTGAVAGVAILAGASGPAAPVVLLGATVVGLGAWAVDSIWGKSDEQSLLENLGVWTD